MASPPVNLGYGAPTEASIDAVNQWMRTTPWYQQLIRSWGQDPNNVHLNDQQKQQIVKQAQANGVVVDEGTQEVDDSGNFRNQGHKLRNTLIVAGLAAATIATMGAAGAFAGGAAAAGAGSSAAGAGAGLAGVEGGAYGLGSGALAGLGSGAMGATSLGAGAAGAGAGAGAAGATAATGGGSMLGAAGKFISGGNGLSGYLDTAGKIGSALGAIGQSRAANRVAESNLTGAQDRNAIDLYRAQLAGQQTGLQAAQTDLNRRNYTLDAPGKRAGNSVRGDILANAQDANVEGIPGVPSFKFSGGLRPSMFSANTRQLGSDMSSQALSQQQAGDNFDPLPTAPTSPNLTPLPQSGVVDSIFNTAGAVSSLAPLMGSIPYGRQQAKQRPDLIPSDENGYG